MQDVGPQPIYGGHRGIAIQGANHPHGGWGPPPHCGGSWNEGGMGKFHGQGAKKTNQTAPTATCPHTPKTNVDWGHWVNPPSKPRGGGDKGGGIKPGGPPQLKRGNGGAHIATNQLGNSTNTKRGGRCMANIFTDGLSHHGAGKAKEWGREATSKKN